MGFPVITRTVKLVSIGVPLPAVIFWSEGLVLGLALLLVVSVGAFLVAKQVGRSGGYYWAAGFCAMAGFFNPFLPLHPLTGKLPLFLVVATAASFALLSSALRPPPLVSTISTGDRARGTQ